LCQECAEPADDVPHDVLIKQGFTDAMLSGATIKKAVGCSICQDGYKGRVGVYEVVRITPAIARIIMEEGNSLQIQDQASEEGFNTLRVSALRKVAQGFISLEEANRITVD
jgi:type IV pilus assembly protein PilB